MASWHHLIISSSHHLIISSSHHLIVGAPDLYMCPQVAVEGYNVRMRPWFMQTERAVIPSPLSAPKPLNPETLKGSHTPKPRNPRPEVPKSPKSSRANCTGNAGTGARVRCCCDEEY
eukprot:2504245-Rhodomonas_salina.1